MLDMGVVEVILAGALGLTVIGVTELIKRTLKTKGAANYAVSLVVSAAGTAYYLVSQHIFALVPFVGYTLLTFAVANGIFKGLHTPTK
jgi:hypothetical protein